ncbi:hypothetical protein RJ639_036974 [Escallonia herrerae]|uniref:Uncharacterized protein n=1 Tax=Escallonia herrerae TaxID=1293975 RepID=A0AA89BDW0_9ASTE|nr:hypothetical protein RJ639_036974 [Escallonia herrerae]
MITGAIEILLWSVFDGSLSMYDKEIDRRPYHRNCNCAPRKLKHACPDAFGAHRSISFWNKKSVNRCSLSLSASRFPSQTYALSLSASRVSSQTCLHGEPPVLFKFILQCQVVSEQYKKGTNKFAQEDQNRFLEKKIGVECSCQQLQDSSESYSLPQGQHAKCDIVEK